MADCITIKTSRMNLVYSDGHGNLVFQTWDELKKSGVTLDSEEGSRLELLGWTTSNPEKYHRI